MPAPAPSPVPPAPAAVDAAAEPTAATSDAPAVAPGGAAQPAAPAAAPEPGASFAAEAKRLFRIAACGNDSEIDPELATIVAAHCKTIRKRMAEFRARYFEGGRAFFDALVPDDAPRTVVYPFGGGDLISALVAFPDATEITTISLELAGDPRRINELPPKHLAASLGALRVEIGGLLAVGSNTSENLSASQKNDLPAQVSSFLMGLAAGGYEPVDMRFFRLGPDGAIQYLEQPEIDAIEAAGRKGKAKSRKGDWSSPNFSEAFANVEIRYRKVGDEQIRVHRHLGWNLADKYLTDHPELLRHLEAKGKVTILTKGASYLLWRGDFSKIRDYMLGHLAWMLSDSTGIPPVHARKAGMVQETYGRYDGAFLEGAESSGKRHSDDFRALWQKNKYRKLPFRFGYVDAVGQPHLVVTRPAK